MKTVLFFISILTFPNFLFSQESKVKFGQVSQQHLAMKVYDPDPEASAVIISKVGWLRYDIAQEEYPLTETRHIVIKLLTQSALDVYGNVEIRYAANNYSKIGNIKAMVHLPDGTEVKVDNTQIFEEATNDFWSSKKIAFPKLIPGAIIEYQYNILSNDVFEPVDWFFQEEIPIIYSELKTQIPEFFDYIILAQGSGLDHKEREVINQSTYNVDFVNHTFINKDVPALKEECCITTMDDYYSRIRFRLNMIKPRLGAHEPIMNSWKKVSELLFDHQNWGGQINNKRPGELVLEAAGIPVAISTNQMETARKLYDYVNHHIQWNEWNSYGTSKSISEILKAKSTDSGSLNKLIWAGLTQAGISVKPILISTRSNGKAIELYPFMDQFDHLLLLANIDGKDVWIDAGNKKVPFGTVNPNSMNSRGLVVDKVNPVWINIKPTDSKTTYLLKGKLNPDGNIEGTIESRFTGYHAFYQRVYAAEEKDKYGEDLLVSGTNAIKLTALELINKDDPSLPLQLKAAVNHPSGNATPDKIYLSHIFPADMAINPFKLESRTYPIEMNYPSETTMIMNLELPEGYVIEALPEPIRYVTESNGIQVVYEATQSPGKLNVTMKYVLKQLYFEAAEYETLKSLYDQRKQKFNEQIVLTKV